MDLNITVEDFKAYFYKDFNYLPLWQNDRLYVVGDIVFYPATQRFYKCIQNISDMFETPQDDSFWQVTVGDVKEYISDFDIQKAFGEANFSFNKSLMWGTPDTEWTANATVAYMYVVAHYLVVDAQMATQGLSSTGYFSISSRSVGDVSEAYSIPQWMLEDPIISAFMTTRYGQKYVQLLKPLLIGSIINVRGRTTFW